MYHSIGTIMQFCNLSVYMLLVFLKDSQKTVEFTDFPGEDPIKFMMNFKKIFPSVFDLILPILPEDENRVQEISWESTSQHFKLFKRLIQDWATVELRLGAISQYKDKAFANELVRQAQQIRKKFQIQQPRLNLLHADYVFLQAIHSLLDAELVELGAVFYLPTLRQNWQQDIPKDILNMTI